MVGDALYFCTGYNRVIALDAETGRERWAFDPGQRARKLAGPYPRVCRGVAYWEADGTAERSAACGRRIFTGTIDSELIALDAATGAPCAGFGAAGRVALREGIDGDAPAWEYYPTSPPLTVHDLVVIGALVADNLRADAPAGVVRAFDARTGKLRWAWDPVPPGYVKRPRPALRARARRTSGPSSRRIRSATCCSCRRATPRPTSTAASATASTTTAAPSSRCAPRRARSSGSFQTVHHDLWDYDVPAQPTLFELELAGRRVPALAQITKMGHLFLLDRDHGRAALARRGAAGAPGRRAGRDASRRPSPSRPTRRRSTRRSSRPRTPSASRPGIAASAPRRSAACATTASSRRRASRARCCSRATPADRTGAASRSTRGAARLFVNQMRIAGLRAAHARAPSTTRSRASRRPTPRSSTRWRARPTRRAAGR